VRTALSARVLVVAAGVFSLSTTHSVTQAKRNVVIFVADGLRPGSVNATDTPALWSVRTKGVNFVNSHSVYPTLTMPNAAAIATGHYPGDTGQFANNVFPGFAMFDRGNFGRALGTLTPSVEDNETLGDLDDHFGGNYIAEMTLLAAASAQGYGTVTVGKLGPTGIQRIDELVPSAGRFKAPFTIILDAGTGAADGVPVSGEAAQMLRAAGMDVQPPARNQSAGTNTTPGTLSANVAHQQWLADAVTKAIVPNFVKSGKPFIVTFWSGDPDQTQHAQGDSLNHLTPGVNGPTSKAAVRNADRSLKQILDYLNANPALRDSTDVFVTADHGFSTVSRRSIDAAGHPTTSYSAKFVYRDANGRQDVNEGALPNGALAIDLAHALNLPLYDPDSQTGGNPKTYQRVDPSIPAGSDPGTVRQRPVNGNGAIGGTGRISPPDALVIVTSSSIYVPSNDKALVSRVVRALAQLDYMGAIFVNDRFGAMPGALSMSAINMIGSAKLPAPAIVISLKHFALDERDPLMTSVMVGGVGQQEGQGSHGVFARANTFNNMAAIGPDFKAGFADPAPVGNVDIQPTLAQILGLKIPSHGALRGRVLTEALKGGSAKLKFDRKVLRSTPEAGKSTILVYQQAGKVRYLDEACFATTARVAGCSVRAVSLKP